MKEEEDLPSESERPVVLRTGTHKDSSNAVSCMIRAKNSTGTVDTNDKMWFWNDCLQQDEKSEVALRKGRWG